MNKQCANEDGGVRDLRANHSGTVSYASAFCACLTVVLALGAGITNTARGEDSTQIARTSLSKYMNSIPPSKEFFCVGGGASRAALHPDRAPYTQLAQQDGVILFSGTAPQQGLNFQLPAGALVYRNQMSTLGAPEPSPQVGTAGGMLQRPWTDFLPWTEARWHPGEDITWHGYRAKDSWMGGIPYWDYNTAGPADNAICDWNAESPELHPYNPHMAQVVNGTTWNLKSSLNLQLARGLYQTSHVRADHNGATLGLCPWEYREPWFQGRGDKPAFNVALSDPALGSLPQRIAADYFPTYHNIYTFNELHLDGEGLRVDFERSATWPRHGNDTGAIGSKHGAMSGASMASVVADEYDNTVIFDRVPDYGWHTDFKTPPASDIYHDTLCDGGPDSCDPNFSALPASYAPEPNAWRLPHKRARMVELVSADERRRVEGTTREAIPEWTVVFVHEHPDSDRISATDVAIPTGVDPATLDTWMQHKSLYSYLPQSSWEFGRLPELSDETTLLTVQAYHRTVTTGIDPDDNITVIKGSFNGAPFQDDYHVWGSTVDEEEDVTYRKHVNAGLEGIGDSNGDGCPGICGVDDDGDGYVDEGGNPNDDNEDGIADWDNGMGTTHGVTPVLTMSNGNTATDPAGDYTDPDPAPGDRPCPGYCGVDDDGDGLIDEDTNGYLPYLEAYIEPECSSYQSGLVSGSAGGGLLQKQTHVPSAYLCVNPLYWEGEWVLGTWPAWAHWESNGIPRDPFAFYDDDEDGLIDEDTENDPFLVHLRMANGECASGVHPFVPAGATLPGTNNWGDECRPPDHASQAAGEPSDPWTYQVQYVYARSNPYWLLVGRESDDQLPSYGQPLCKTRPDYYYFPPFDPDINGDGDTDDLVCRHLDGKGVAQEFYESDLGAGDGSTVVDSNQSFDTDGLPNVHPDCLPNPKFRGPQGEIGSGSSAVPLKPVEPSEIHLIKRIVRVREETDTRNYIERVWLYRYNDLGFVKAIFDPTSIAAILGAAIDDEFVEVDDILKYADTHPVAGRPLITYANQWYTYYNPRPTTLTDEGIPPCYDNPPFTGVCLNSIDFDDPIARLPINGCDGEYAWQTGYVDEFPIDPDCSEFMRQDCGWCAARDACRGSCSALECTCSGSVAADEDMLVQMGIPGAQPRFRKYQIKTARVRGGDGNMHLYRFDYLGAANSVYADPDRITSYADAHNITVVDELVEQDADELANPGDFSFRNEFYIYEDGFRLVLDPAETRHPSYDNAPMYHAGTHYLHVPVKVKTRRVVTMNYYGIALSDRLIVTPGFKGDHTVRVDDQQYELVNVRGQVKHLYDPSWVATLDQWGHDFVKNSGRVLVELFGGHQGWHSVLRGIAWGSRGGNLYDQQCATPEVIEDVPVQRVTPEQLHVVSATEHFEREPSNTPPDADGLIVRDMPKVEAVFYGVTQGNTFDFIAGTCDNQDTCDDGVYDPAGTIGDGSNQSESGDGCDADGQLVGIDLHDQRPAQVHLDLFNDTGDPSTDGVSKTRYHYKFYSHGTLQGDDSVKWKWRWREPVPLEQGGTSTDTASKVALEVSYFDYNGRLRLSGRGAGEVTGTTDDPILRPAHPFYVSYYGYDQLGRQSVQVEDFDVRVLDTDPGGDTYANLGFDASQFPGTEIPTYVIPALFVELDDNGQPIDFANHTTWSGFNAAGMMTSRQEGPGCIAPNDCPFRPTADGAGDAIRTDYQLISNRKIMYKDTNEKTQQAWEDENTYSLEYSYVTHATGETDERVNGTTKVTVMDKGGRFKEQRVIAWAGPRGDKIDSDEDLGWGISLTDYDYDGRIADHWGIDDIPRDLWQNETCTDAPNCNQDTEGLPDLIGGDIDPPYPGDYDPPLGDPVDNDGDWPPVDDNQIVTLARSFKLYNEPATLKPSHEITFSSFDTAPAGSPDDDRRMVIREYMYDLEERIARQKDPDGTVSRSLFDPKRRPTKTFRGTIDEDDCGWFPPSGATGADNMALVEHRLYNDGDPDREYTPYLGETVVASTGINTDFPKDAGKLVRNRRFTGNAESCDIEFNADAHSRDTQFIYDWRGRQVISKNVTVGYGDGTADAPTFVSAKTVVFDNLDRPVLTATWDNELAAPLTTPAIIDGWSLLPANAAAADILDYGPVSLTQTYYDERGRTYEQRTYDTGYTTGGLKYTYARTYRDDVDRVIAEVTPGGMRRNEYDRRGNVLATSFWSEAAFDPAIGPFADPSTYTNGVELTRSVTTYDAFGNVETQTNYDRKDDATGIHLGTGNAIITYTHNWYDAAKRLVATAGYGTNVPGDGFTNATTPPTYVANTPPTWTGQAYSLADALVTRYGYDAAGRQIWAQGPMGRVTRTWYDLLGRKLLVAENWLDRENLDPSGGALTLSEAQGFVGPTRYTAYHYTRSGLLDGMVAIVPANAQDSAAFIPEVRPRWDSNGTWAAINWNEAGSSTDFGMGETISIESPTQNFPWVLAFQATKFVYGGEILDESNHAADPISVGPQLVSEIRYPDADPANPGQPSSTDKLAFQYTLNGQVATRTDQRGVTLDYLYGDHTGSGSGCSSCSSGDQISRVSVDYTGSTGVDQTIDHLTFGYDSRGNLTAAAVYNDPDATVQLSRVEYDYSSFGNLIAETLDPGDGTTSPARSVYYDWSWDDLHHSRLNSVQYPSAPGSPGPIFDYDYGTAGSVDDHINRMTGMSEHDGASVIAYGKTGGGRTVTKTWGPSKIQLDFNPSQGTPGWDQYGRITEMSMIKDPGTGSADEIQAYRYGYDDAGNRLYARIKQAGGLDNTHSYRYKYDPLSRLSDAGYGALDTPQPGTLPEFPAGTGPMVTNWQLDVLGNWAAGEDPATLPYEPSVHTYTDTAADWIFQGKGVDTSMERIHDVADETNKIKTRALDGDTAPTDYVYDDAGNLTDDTAQTYVYDAWGRVVQVITPGAKGASVTTTNDYDALGRRIRTHKHVVSPPDLPMDFEHYYYYDGSRVIEQRNANDALKGRYVWGLDYVDEQVAQYQGAGAALRYVLQDANYNVTGLTNAAGTVVEQYRYEPYGELVEADLGDGVPVPATTLTNRTLHQGLAYDPDTNLYHNRAREYNPKLGRFMQRDPDQTGLPAIGASPRAGTGTAPGIPASLQRDPAGYSDGMNVYEYVSSRPTRFADPLGLWKIKRRGGARATAIAERGDTVTSLARKINLDPVEYKQWLRATGESVWPGSATAPIDSGVYSIPNTVVLLRGELSMADFWIGFRIRAEEYNAWTSMEEQGFQVDRVNLSTSEQMITRLSGEPDLHGFEYWGHGGAMGYLVPAGTKKGKLGPAASGQPGFVTPSDLDLHHKLAFIRLHACYSAEDINNLAFSWKNLIAPGGEFFGIEEEYKVFWNSGPNDPIVITMP